MFQAEIIAFIKTEIKGSKVYVRSCNSFRRAGTQRCQQKIVKYMPVSKYLVGSPTSISTGKGYKDPNFTCPRLSSTSASLFPILVLLFEFSVSVNNATKVLSYLLPKDFLNQPCLSLSLLSKFYRGIFPGVTVTLWAQPNNPFLHFSSNSGHLPQTQV